MALQLPILDARSRFANRRGFTLIELLTVIAIIGILAAILFTSMSRVRIAAKDSRCLSNLRQIQSANMMHAADHKGNYVRIKAGGLWWFVQPDFYNYLDARKSTSTSAYSMLDDLKCPNIEYLQKSGSTWEKENFPGYGYRPYGVTTANGAYSYLNQNNVTSPSLTMAFGDGLDFHFYKIPSSTYDWENESKRVATISYRHQNGCCVVYFDGHAERLDRAEIEPMSKHKALWSGL